MTDQTASADHASTDDAGGRRQHAPADAAPELYDDRPARASGERVAEEPIGAERATPTEHR